MLSVGSASAIVRGSQAQSNLVDDARDQSQVTRQLQQNVEQAMLALYMENAQTMVAHAENSKVRSEPYGHLQSFGREDTAAELTEASIGQSNSMIDQIERAVVSETKRSMFRALTRLRGVTVSSYDGMANAQSANIDDYAANNKWRASNEIQHLASREGQVESWAFPASKPYAPNKTAAPLTVAEHTALVR